MCYLFSLAAFSILSLSLIFVIFIISCFGVFLFVFILYGTLCTSWSWMLVSFPRLGKFLAVIYSNIFSGLLSLFSSGTPIMQILVHLMLSQRYLKLSFLFILFFFFFFCSAVVISTALSSCTLVHSSVSFSLLLASSSIYIFAFLF